MLIVQAGTADYTDMMDETRHRCESWGYDYVRHGLQFDPEDMSGGLPPCTFKPRMLDGLPPNEITAWLDADAVPLRPFHAELRRKGAFDVAVTLREQNAVGRTQPTTNFLNAGVIFFRGFDACRFIDRWQTETDRVGNDQLALNGLVGQSFLGREWTVEDWLASYGASHLISLPQACRVLVLPALEWNFYHFDSSKPGPEVKILHFKRGWRQLNGPDWWREALAAAEKVAA